MYKKEVCKEKIYTIFEEGDRIKVVNDFGCSKFGVKIGMTGVVLEEDSIPYVKFDQDIELYDNVAAMIPTEMELNDGED